MTNIFTNISSIGMRGLKIGGWVGFVVPSLLVVVSWLRKSEREHKEKILVMLCFHHLSLAKFR